MQWIIKYLTSSIGKKQIMGCTGAVLAMFILGHMVGNIQLINPNPEAAQASYNAYSELLTKYHAFIYTVELVMVLVFVTHVFLAVTLKLENRKARGSETYEVDSRKGRKTFATFTMIWSGLFVLAFLISHLYMLKFGSYYYYQNVDVAGGEVVRDMWLTTIMMFSQVPWSAFYVIGMFILGLHLFHAISSAFQTLGVAHQKWTPIIEKIGMIYSIVVAGGFLFVAAGSFILAGKPETQSLIERSKNLEVQKNLEQLKQFQEQKKTSFLLPLETSDVQVSYVSTINGGR